MIKVFAVENGRLQPAESEAADWSSIIWADLLNPTKREEQAIETWIGVEVPTREEMEEIEISSRLYVENGAYFMTATVPSQAEGDDPIMSPVTFVLSGKKLVTIRYHEPRAFSAFPAHAEKAAIGCSSGKTILIGLLEAIVDRLADVLERASREVEAISKDIFNPAEKNASKRDRDFQKVLKALGSKESLTSKMRDSLVSLQRLSGFLANAANQTKDEKDVKPRDQDTVPRRCLYRRPRRFLVAENHLLARCDARHDQHRAERHHQDRLGRRGGLSAADPGGIDLRHELRRDA